ncbi:MAG: hypothetical protein HN352_14430 [Bacteroidetes bacterium]|jgi:hypothetical protein|nr:hypothetical protein [Bacteroidota bacterium]MBT3748983.1 hypothetical protein [Bacteroidota bacterium]MBT4398423.1 hypothetical protein [Bacteroidota bacterium]MBT4412315.1 hypothetical protein [Bacteroidota bacterium]MBT5425010.1 hypothetical protein [Bacteroidota bacterium]
MSSGFPSGLVSSMTADLVAWVENLEGVRNIFVSNGQETQQITNYSRDDGQEISNLIISPDNTFIIFERGGAPNQQGEIPNPLSLAEKTKRQIWKINTDDKKPVLISEGDHPVLSSDGKTLLFSRRGQA